MSESSPPASLDRRSFLRALGVAGALLALTGCGATSGGASPTPGAASPAAVSTVPHPTPAVATPASTGSPTTASPSPASAASPGSSPTAGRVVGAAPIPKPPPTPGGIPPTPIGVTPVSTQAAAPSTTPGSASGGAQYETGAPTTPVAQARATGTAVPGSNAANAAPPAASGTPQPSVTVSIGPDGKFNPQSVTINAGQAVKWVNDGRYPQTVTDDPVFASNKSNAALPAGAQPWNSGILNTSQTFVHAFTVAGTYQYFSVPFEGKGVIGHITVK